MNRGKIVAIITGALSILLALAYLVIVQILDFRGEMKPAPISQVGVQNVKLIHKYFGVTSFQTNYLACSQSQSFIL
ncbi:hypothetical protein [Mastigocoleus testarum]|uniref:Glucose-inhibited division protein A n=1 Tax=Mastigocoleus testarum BC008 TaxID=371196 RepID=A0A0V7ZZF2_9CYAN|nr:hypothetical protein [Mastigocoleus testarum]KST69936.1 hypothetical protein BC008_05730 [Mastigocoleus testarum BC008]KST69947.1 hypothetical protein BC008_05780 [Mastigocoleus testarum BC008]